MIESRGFPVEALREVGRLFAVMADGKDDPPDGPLDWERRTPYYHASKAVGHMLRAGESGVACEDDSGRPHLAHAALRCMMALELALRQPEP